MAVKVVLTNSSKPEGVGVTLRSQEIAIPLGQPPINMSRSIYQNLRSLAKNKTLVSDYTSDKLPKEYMEFLKQMDILYALPGSGTTELVALDVYLGELGLTEYYHYDKDIIEVAVWIEATSQDPFRPVVHAVPHTDPSQVVIDRATGDRVLHNTYYLDTI